MGFDETLIDAERVFPELEYAAEEADATRSLLGSDRASRRGRRLRNHRRSAERAKVATGHRLVLHRMLRMYIAQQCFDSPTRHRRCIHDSCMIRRFVGIDLAKARTRQTRRRCSSFVACSGTNGLTRARSGDRSPGRTRFDPHEGTIVDTTFIATRRLPTKNQAKGPRPRDASGEETANNWISA